MKGGDTYGKVLLNESANEFYGKKLKELFGENYLAVIDVEGAYSYTDFEEEMKKRKKSYEEIQKEYILQYQEEFTYLEE